MWIPCKSFKNVHYGNGSKGENEHEQAFPGSANRLCRDNFETERACWYSQNTLAELHFSVSAKSVCNSYMFSTHQPFIFSILGLTFSWPTKNSWLVPFTGTNICPDTTKRQYSTAQHGMAQHSTAQHGTMKEGENPINPDPRTKEAPNLVNALALPVAVHKPQLLQQWRLAFLCRKLKHISS